MARKTKELEETTKAAEPTSASSTRRSTRLYVKVDSLQSSDINRAIKQKEEMLKTALAGPTRRRRRCSTWKTRARRFMER